MGKAAGLSEALRPSPESDAADAAAICEAVTQSSARFAAYSGEVQGVGPRNRNRTGLSRLSLSRTRGERLVVDEDVSGQVVSWSLDGRRIGDPRNARTPASRAKRFVVAVDREKAVDGAVCDVIAAALVEARRTASVEFGREIIRHGKGGLGHAAPGFLHNPEVRRWLRGVEPAWTLLRPLF